MISLIVAMDINRLIGKEDRIPWKIRDDLIRLKHLTQNHTVILGRTTYESMAWYYDKSGRPMPAKIYIVLTRDPGYQPKRSSGKVAHSIEEAIKLAKSLGDDQIFVNGGASVYKAMLPYADTIYLTEVHTEAKGDTYFPALSPEQWQETEREQHKKDDKNEYDFDMIIFKKVRGQGK